MLVKCIVTASMLCIENRCYPKGTIIAIDPERCCLAASEAALYKGDALASVTIRAAEETPQEAVAEQPVEEQTVAEESKPVKRRGRAAKSE